MHGSEPWRLDAARLAEGIREGDFTAVDVVGSHLQRISEVNPEINAVVVTMADEAMERARQADEHLQRGDPIGRLHGVPFTVKENIDVKGSATTWGVPNFSDAIAAADAPIVERMRAAGAIPIGRTNMPNMALRVHTKSTLRGLTINPWDPTVTAGGSSGGDASALACGMTPLGLGNDIGGSLRNPAHCCGVAALKPTTHRLPRASGEPLAITSQMMNVDGPMARSVADLELALGVMAGPHPSDPFVRPADPRAEKMPKTVALMTNPPGGTADGEIESVVRRAAQALSEDGYEVHEVVPPRYEEILELWGQFIFTDLERSRADLSLLVGADGSQLLAHLDDRYSVLESGEFSRLFEKRHRIIQEWNSFFADYSVILSPTWTQPPFEEGWDVSSRENTFAVFELMRPVMPANFLGLPAVVVPGGLSAGLPVGVQVMGKWFNEESCLQAARVVEGRAGAMTPIDPKRPKVTSKSA